jgi:hypothetical protein
MARMAPTRSSIPARYVHTLHLEAGPPRSTTDPEELDLRDRIAELEEQLRTAPEHEGRRRAAMRDLVPPTDRRIVWRRTGNAARLTKQEQQLVARERRAHVLVSLVLVTMLIGLLNWLAHLLRV